MVIPANIHLIIVAAAVRENRTSGSGVSDLERITRIIIPAFSKRSKKKMVSGIDVSPKLVWEYWYPLFFPEVRNRRMLSRIVYKTG